MEILAENPRISLSKIKGDLSGALSAAIITLPMSIGYGIIAFAPLGDDFAPQAAVIGVHTAVIAGFFAALFGSASIQITGPKAPLTLVLGSLVATLVLNQAAAYPASVIVGLASLCVLFAGTFQIMFGFMGLTNFVKYIPQPVISGFMNGIALLLIFKQLRPLLGMDPAAPFSDLFRAPDSTLPTAMLVGTVTIASIFLAKRYMQRIPASLIALIVGTLTFYLLVSFSGGMLTGKVIGELELTIPQPNVFIDLYHARDVLSIKALLPTILFASLIISILASLESMLSSVVCDDLLATRHDSKRELIGQGIGNMTSALFGSLPGAGSIPRSAANYRSGGRTRLSGMMCSVFILIMVTLLGPFVGMIPIAVVAGIIFVVGVNLLDTWSLNILKKILSEQSMKKDVIIDFLIMACVAMTTIFVNLIVAVTIGMIIASALFISNIGRSVIKCIYYGHQLQSKCMRNHEENKILNASGHKIVIIFLQGPLFFGSSEYLAQKIQSLIETSNFIILDFKLVTTIDSTGSKILIQIKRQIEKKDGCLILSNLKSNKKIMNYLNMMNVTHTFDPKHILPDTDTALEWAENSLLMKEIPHQDMFKIADLSKHPLFDGFSLENFQQIHQMFRKVTFEKGDLIISENDHDRDLYILTKGLITVNMHLPEKGYSKRLYTYAPGTIIGEMSFLDGSPRSVSVWARIDSEALCLSYDTFQNLLKSNSPLAAQLSLNIAKEMSQRLRMTSNQLRQLEDLT